MSERGIAVVTGASRGIGRAIAEGLAGAGFPVALLARDATTLAPVAEAVAAAGGRALPVAVDVADPAAVAGAAARVAAELGPAEVLVNGAGSFGPIVTVAESDPDVWLDAFRTNVIGTYLCCQAFVGPMLERGRGRIVNLTSASSLHPPSPMQSCYGTSKTAVNRFTRHLAAELQGSGVTANVLHPGDVQTAMWADIRDQAEGLGAVGEPLLAWTSWVDETGGDPPAKAAEVVLRLALDERPEPNGAFLWIEDGQQPAIDSWEPVAALDRPWGTT